MSNDILRWRDGTWGERAQLLVIHFVLWGVVFPAMLLGGMLLFGAIIDGAAEYKTELSRCQKRAATPYEYHKCK